MYPSKRIRKTEIEVEFETRIVRNIIDGGTHTGVFKRVLVSERPGRYAVADLKALEYGSQLEHLTDKPATTKMEALRCSKP